MEQIVWWLMLLNNIKKILSWHYVPQSLLWSIIFAMSQSVLGSSYSKHLNLPPLKNSS